MTEFEEKNWKWSKQWQVQYLHPIAFLKMNIELECLNSIFKASGVNTPVHVDWISWLMFLKNRLIEMYTDPLIILDRAY